MAEAVTDFAEENMIQGAADYPRWMGVTGRAGGGLAVADISVADPEAALLALCDERTRLLSISSVGIWWSMSVTLIGQHGSQRTQPGALSRSSLNMLSIHALDASLSLFDELGMAAVEQQLISRSSWLMAWVRRQPNLLLVTPDDPGRFAGIISFRVSYLDRAGHMELYKTLMAEGVICACRDGAIRLSPHFYSNVELFPALWQRVLLIDN